MATNMTFTDFQTIVPADWLNNVNSFVNSHNVVRLINTPGTTNTWTLYNPTGGVIPTIGTTTNGLQEAINYITTYGYNLEVIGCTTPPYPGNQFGIIFCSTGLVFPALRTTTIRMVGVHIIFTSAVTGAGITFDSMDEVDIQINGEIVYQGNGNAVSFRPVNPVPVDGGTFIDASRVHIDAIATNGGNPNCCVIFDTSAGAASISFLDFSCNELNGAGAANQPPVCLYGVLVGNPQANTSFEMNKITLGHVHECIHTGVQIGTTQTNQTNMRGNIWDIGSIKCSGQPTAYGFDTFGEGDLVRIGMITNEEGAFNNGIVCNVGANGNNVQVGGIIGNTGPGVVFSNGSYQNTVYVGTSIPGSGGTTLQNQGLNNYVFGAAKPNNIYNPNFTVIYEPDGTIIQTINNAGSSTGGVFTAFPVTFPTQCDSCVITPTNQVVSYSASPQPSGVTIFSASGTPSFNIIARGR